MKGRADLREITLRQSGTEAQVTLSFRKHGDSTWWLVAPSTRDVDAARDQMLVRYGGHALPPDAYLQMRDARDTMSAFASAFSHWDSGGSTQALATLDISQLSSATRTYEGLLAAQYLKRAIDRVGQLAPQEIPNDPADRQPYVYFDHPAGKIVIAPTGPGNAPVWKFTAETVRTAAALFAATEAVPIGSSGALPPPPSAFFALRALVAKFSPVLLTAAGPLELWQVLTGLLLLALCLAAAVMLTALVVALVRLDVGGSKLRAEHGFVWPLRLALTGALFKLVVPILGWSEQVRSVTAPIHALVIAVFGVWAGWYLITALGYNISERAAHSTAKPDEIVVSLVLALLRLAMLFAAISYAAEQLSVPTNGLLAGLGISGLAVAFASKETLSNIFGAGILVIDHPFRRGDWIVADSVQGTVEHVGIRSTRIRTAEDTVMIVPNGKLSDAAINNWGTRRCRLSHAKLLVSYGSTPAQLDAFIAGLRRIVATTPGAVADRTQVGVIELGENGIAVDFTTYLNVTSLTEERSTNHTLMLQVLVLASQLGLKLGPVSRDAVREPVPSARLDAAGEAA